jgi:hypothetical protein
MNPTLRTLGFASTDRVVILHADDIGSSHSSVAAYIDLLEAGIMSSAATMVPCPWFPATAALCRQHQGHPRLDMGVHLTLNSEWVRFGMPLFDHADVMSLDQHQHRLEEAVERLAQAPAGLTYFLFHPAVDTPELRTFVPDWRSRVADYELLASDVLYSALQPASIHVIGWRAIRGVMREA